MSARLAVTFLAPWTYQYFRRDCRSILNSTAFRRIEGREEKKNTIELTEKRTYVRINNNKMIERRLTSGSMKIVKNSSRWSIRIEYTDVRKSDIVGWSRGRIFSFLIGRFATVWKLETRVYSRATFFTVTPILTRDTAAEK